LQKEAAKGIVGERSLQAVATLAPKAPRSGAEAILGKEAEIAREATCALATGASKEKETTLAANKEARPLKKSTCMLTAKASKEGDATPVPMAETKDKGKNHLHPVKLIWRCNI
jgi:hypothetical protein